MQSILSRQLVRRDSSEKLQAHPTALLGDTFIVAAASLFVTAARISRISQELDPMQLQQQLVHQIQQFEVKLQRENVRSEQIFIAKYFICALLDDLLEHEWLGGQGLWRAYALLSYFFQENNTEDRVFILMEHLQREPAMNIALIEVAYMILIYGYQGPCRQSNQGYFKLLERMDELYRILNMHYGDFRKSLFIQTRT